MPTVVNVGDVLAGKYRVEKVLGVGGMGMVVAATHLELEQRVALKFMLPDATRVAHAVDRFLREAKAVVKLRSEHVCRVMDVGRLDDGAPYIVMELLEGEDFADVLNNRTRLPAQEAVDLMLQAIEGVAEAHTNQIVHRDLKPANLFVTVDGDGSPLVKVLDFGISKSSVAGSATKTGDIMGSPSYMAPEQLMSTKSVDARADIWALGVIMYQAVTGELPFEGESLPVLCMAVLHDQPRAPIEIRPELPRVLSDVIMRCLDKRPEQRFSDVGQLATVLAPLGGTEATLGAARVQKVLRRASGPALAITDTKPGMAPPVSASASAPEPVRPSVPATAPETLTEPAPAPEPVQVKKPTTTLTSGSGAVTIQRRRSKLPVVFAALAAVSVIAAVLIITLSKKDEPKPAPAVAPIAAVTAPFVEEPVQPSVRRKPKLQVTQLTDDAPEVKAVPKAPPRSSDPAAAPRATTTTPLRPAQTVETPATSGSAAQTPAQPGDASSDSKSLAALLQNSGFVGKWLATRLGDTFLVKNLGAMAKLQIVSNPSGASVMYEGAVIGKTPLSIEVERGAYDILVDLALEGRVDRTVLIPAMFDASTTVEMPPPAVLRLLSKPAGAEVETAGEIIGKTPLEIKMPPDETQVFILRLEKYEEKVVELTPTKSTTETIVLDKKLQQIVHELDSVPSGAEVLLNGAVIGKTPFKTEFLEVRGTMRQYVLHLPGDGSRYSDTFARLAADKSQKRLVKLRDICADKAPEVDTGRPTLSNPYDPCRNK